MLTWNHGLTLQVLSLNAIVLITNTTNKVNGVYVCTTRQVTVEDADCICIFLDMKKTGN